PDTVERALCLHKKSIGELISLFEDSRPESLDAKKNVLQELKTRSEKNAVVIGITGTPGSGKSSLIGKIAPDLIKKNSSISVAVLAVDPSSRFTGGSILGDRIRTRFPPDEKRLFFRSQPSENLSGGTGKNTYQVSRLISYLFDILMIETVGTGQEDTEIQFIADKTFLIIEPGAGDRIQYIKSGIMEIPDFIIMNKSDREYFEESFYNLESSLQLNDEKSALFKASAVTGEGINIISENILKIKKEKTRSDTDLHHLIEWIRNEYGLRGLAIINSSGGAENIFHRTDSLEDSMLLAENTIEMHYRDH
ncbi:MAG: protein kinase, partial [Spirochaetia bacterium]|nr:protein kinase [Spirochaetia bacterium]